MDELSLEQLVLGCIDWTTLRFDECESDLENMLLATRSLDSKPAACCIPPAWVTWWADRSKPGDPALATVLNFPAGNEGIEKVMHQATDLREADEWDVVFPHEAFQRGDLGFAKEFMQAIRGIAQGKSLKVILETGLQWNPKALVRAAELALDEGAHFLKTSTGKVPVGATPEAVALLCVVLRGTGCGLKVSGGIRNLDVAKSYALQAASALGSSFIHPSTFRVGTSTLLQR